MLQVLPDKLPGLQKPITESAGKVPRLSGYDGAPKAERQLEIKRRTDPPRLGRHGDRPGRLHLSAERTTALRKKRAVPGAECTHRPLHGQRRADPQMRTADPD